MISHTDVAREVMDWMDLILPCDGSLALREIRALQTEVTYRAYQMLRTEPSVGKLPRETILKAVRVAWNLSDGRRALQLGAATR